MGMMATGGGCKVDIIIACSVEEGDCHQLLVTVDNAKAQLNVMSKLNSGSQMMLSIGLCRDTKQSLFTEFGGSVNV
jgi:hypothetical protein